MNLTCPHCGNVLRRWRCIPYAVGGDRFRCTVCATWLQYEFRDEQRGWFTRQLDRPAALFLAPPIIATVLVAAALVLLPILSLFSDAWRFAFAVLVFGAILLREGMKTVSQITSARLVIADSQGKRFSLETLRRSWRAATSPKELKRRARHLALYVQTSLYVWMMFKALAWVAGSIETGQC